MPSAAVTINDVEIVFNGNISHDFARVPSPMNYYLWREGNQEGPYTREAIEQAIGDGSLLSGTLARPENGSEWKQLQVLLARKTLRPEAVIACIVVLLGVVGYLFSTHHSSPSLSTRDTSATSPEASVVRDSPEQLLRDTDVAMRSGQFSRAAELMNHIVSDYPDSRQARTVHALSEFVRTKQSQRGGPLTATETQKIRSSMDAFDQIRINYRTTTREKRRALENIFGADTFRSSDGSIESFSNSAANLQDALGRARSGN